MEIEDGERVINKIEKGCELVSKAHNLQLHLKGDTPGHTLAHSISKELVSGNYYDGKQLELTIVTKHELRKRTLFFSH